MNNFGLDKSYEQFDFEEITVEDLEVISGGTGGGRSLSPVEGSIALTGIAIGAAAAGMTVAAPVAAVGAAVLGIMAAANAMA